jgi:hypothetical protein
VTKARWSGNKPHWLTYPIVGDASGVQDSAGVPPDDNDIVYENACASRPYDQKKSSLGTLPRARSPVYHDVRPNHHGAIDIAYSTT